MQIKKWVEKIEIDEKGDCRRKILKRKKERKKERKKSLERENKKIREIFGCRW